MARASKKQKQQQQPEQVNFGDFVAAIREYDLGADENRATAHTSAVVVRDWERVQAALEARGPQQPAADEP